MKINISITKVGVHVEIDKEDQVQEEQLNFEFPNRSNLPEYENPPDPPPVKKKPADSKKFPGHTNPPPPPSKAKTTKEKKCACCGESFKPRSNVQKYCSDKCSKKVSNENYRNKKKDK